MGSRRLLSASLAVLAAACTQPSPSPGNAATPTAAGSAAGHTITSEGSIAMTELTKDEVLNAVLDSLSYEEVKSSIVYWDQRVLEKGESVNLGSKVLELGADATLAFVDLEPRANWGHACAYFLIDLETRRVERHAAEFPPYFDDPPPEYRVLLRYGEPPPHDRHFDVFD